LAKYITENKHLSGQITEGNTRKKTKSRMRKIYSIRNNAQSLKLPFLS
jgi:hypothetical protein